jgi:RNA polymerase sigma-54 factor
LILFLSLRPRDWSWSKIRVEIQQIIDKESKTQPLSDDAIAKELGKVGVTVARHTVTKYRKAMNIPNSRGRRERTKGEK